MSERREDLFKYLDLLVKAEGNGHKVNREIDEVVKEIKLELSLDNQPKFAQVTNGDLCIKSGTIVIEDIYYVINSKEKENLSYFSFKKNARYAYVKFLVKPKKDIAGINLTIEDVDGNILGNLKTQITKEEVFTIIGDLGIPDGKQSELFVKVSSLNENNPTKIRILSRWLEG